MTHSYNKYILLVITAALISACSVTKKYERPETISTDKLYRDQTSADSTTIANMPWQSVFKDEKLNALIQKGLDQNLNLKNAIENKSNVYKESLKRELSFMSKNVGKVILSMKIESEASNANLNISFDSSFNVKGMMSTLANIGGMVALGATLGSFFPIVGNIVGGVLGGFLAIGKALWNTITGNGVSSRQSAFRDALRSKQSEVISKLNIEVVSMKMGLQTEISKTITPVLEAEYNKMQDIERILSVEIQTISSLKQRIKEKEYGTV